MTLYEYLQDVPDGEEITLWDTAVDVETYGYGMKGAKPTNDLYYQTEDRFFKLLNVTEICEDVIVVGFYEVAEKCKKTLREKYFNYNIGCIAIVDFMVSAINGFLSESSYKEFVDILEEVLNRKEC